MDTIFALATAQGRAGVAVVRISGEKAFSSAKNLMSTLPETRGLRRLTDREGVHLDDALVLVFPFGQSFTGEPVVELHLHGSIAVVGAVLGVLGDDPNLRHAEAGEFTRRALENGKLDLAQVEGLADLIDAETEVQRKQALRVLDGALGVLADDWRSKLLRAAALVEATIDFADEDVPVDVRPEVMDLISNVIESLGQEAAGVVVAERLRHGFEIAIVGPPNAGKSTLLNRLAGREAAITSEVAGTTRDIIEVRMDLDGLPVTILDTAGLRESNDIVESIGIERAKKRAEDADLRVFLRLDGESPTIKMFADDIIVDAKADIAGGSGISGLTGEGVDDLVRSATKILNNRVATVGIAIRERHRSAMIRAIKFLEDAANALAGDQYMEDLVAEDIRTATRSIDSLLGRIDVEDVLGEIFSSFCIGK